MPHKACEEVGEELREGLFQPLSLACLLLSDLLSVL
jgi:hypothetical protein